MSTDVVIVGGGISGLGAAYSLLLRGFSVTVLERGRIGQESSWAGGGILFPLLPWHYSDAVNRLVLHALDAYPGWIAGIEARSGLATEFWQCGMQIHAEPLDTALQWCSSHEVEVRPLHDTATDAPVGIELPGVAQARNPRLIRSLLEAVRKLGGLIIENSETAGIQTSGNRIHAVLSNRDRVVTDRVVVASGAWAGQGLPNLPGAPNIRPIRGQMLLFKLEPGVLNTLLYRQGLYVIPRLDGHILVGSTLEDAGFDKSTDAETARHLHAQAAELLPALAGAQPIRHWAGLRPGSPGNIPVIGRHPDFDNVFVNAGHYRYGVTMAPAASDLLADLMEGRTPALDPAPYSWAAAQARHWGDTL